MGPTLVPAQSLTVYRQSRSLSNKERDNKKNNIKRSERPKHIKRKKKKLIKKNKRERKKQNGFERCNLK